MNRIVHKFLLVRDDIMSEMHSIQPATTEKIFGATRNKPVKLDRRRKVWYLFLHAFQALLAKTEFLKGDEAQGYVSTQS